MLAVIPHDGDDDAVRIANNSIFGLSGGVFSRDEERALAVARRIRSGTFSVNGGNWFGPDAPFGGYKQSGIGREMGVAGLEEFLERKTFAAVPAAGESMSADHAGPMEGIRVLEVAMYGFVPSAGAVMADWGADVIKVEHAVTGDPQRGMRQTGPTASRATRTPTSSTRTGASAASAWTSPRPGARRSCMTWPAARTCS